MSIQKRKSRPGRNQSVYFPLIGQEIQSSNQIQVASIYDIDGNALLLNENVLANKNYQFVRYSSIYVLLG